MKYNGILLALLLISVTSFTQAGKGPIAKGKLFIIGGGDRSVQLMTTLINTSQLKKQDYIVILPMSSAEPDTSYYYIRQDLEKVCTNTIANLNFTRQLVTDKLWLDSLKKAKLIFITGGDQNRFMDVVLHTPVHDAIMAAYFRGSTIAGTSAGAAVMSKQMITGNEFIGDSISSGSFKKIRYNLVEIKEGLGLVKTAIIDQHFIARSRYNRLLSVLAEHPDYPCIGIDEEAAIIVNGKNVTITGEGQVILLISPVKSMHAKNKELVKMKNIRLDILASGDVFKLR